ncbi:FRG domain-containing protein [Arcobacter sp. YIC-310]|uniref:FRG domain-containing protein n=1 Tax=Arcobacter sp. YIC-310 TaxID=3376632 RepID=UPI003C1B75FB
MIFYPNLKSLKQKLRVKPVNTGKKFNYRGIEYSDIEGLYALVGINGCLHFKSGISFATFQYRGQIEDFGVCNTTLDRCKSNAEQFLSICRTIAFEDILEVHPFIKYIQSLPPFGENSLCLNLTGLAQHYELHTNYLDITNSFDVASFFATCKYVDGKYYPILNSSKHGVIYRINEMMLSPAIKTLDNDIELEYLGWQPLPRPEEQKASVLKLSKGTNLDNIFGVEKHYFRHSSSQSRKIWKQFDKGKVLFPNDSAAALANEYKTLTSFTENQLKKALKRFKTWNGSELQNKEEVLDILKIQIVEDNKLSWNNLVETDFKYWDNKFHQTLKKVKFR